MEVTIFRTTYTQSIAKLTTRKRYESQDRILEQVMQRRNPLEVARNRKLDNYLGYAEDYIQIYVRTADLCSIGFKPQVLAVELQAMYVERHDQNVLR